ncbi:MAG: L-rhamnose isomerase [Lentisphaeria bacterium]|nr:L-rhamnose isomerase [Lentisphaeria bacterium]
MSMIEKSFEIACEIYQSYGIDPVKAMEKLENIPISLHAWQGDDVVGFENFETAHTGGCQVTGNYPGRARTADELRADLDQVMALLPGTKRVCLQAHQVDKMIPGVDRDGFTIEHFSSWLDWAKAKKIAMDIAPCYYSHPKLDNGLSLSHPDAEIRKFWIDHGRAVRRIAARFGQELGSASVCNFWMPDGFKDIPADRYTPRKRMAESLNTIFSEKLDEKYILDCVESKLFGIGVESCTVGSHDFFLMYAARNNKMICLDSGHFHPTESIGDKLSAIIAQQGRILLHVSRGVRWDSDHVILLNDELLSIAREAAVYGYLDKIFFCLDYFDGSINRIAAMTIGARNLQKALLIALLEPTELLKKAESEFDFTSRMALQEKIKTLPWASVWSYFCEKSGLPGDFEMMQQISSYESKVLSLRK